MGFLLLPTHLQSRHLFFNLSTKSRSKNSKDKVAVAAEAQSKVRKCRSQETSRRSDALTSSHSEVTLHSGAQETVSEPLNHVSRRPASHWILYPRHPGMPQEGKPMGLSMDGTAQEPCRSLAISSPAPPGRPESA